MRAGKKLTIYSKIKQEWGCEDYLAGTSKGVVLMTRFRSGSIGVGEELARYGGGTGILEEDGTERSKSSIVRFATIIVWNR